MNYKINISYDGTEFSGWQTQPHLRTVQSELQNSIYAIFNDKDIILYGSGRTDAGVHANRQVANFIINTKMSTSQIKNALNSKLSKDIYINDCMIVNDDFNARFSAVSRQYIYKICTEFNPLSRKYFWYLTYDLDKDMLVKCSEIIFGEHDFKNFCKTSSEKENNNCTVNKSKWIFDNEFVYFEISANRFLHHMVRMLVGTMIEVSKGSLTFEIFEQMIDCNQSKSRIITSPAHGLYLNKIIY